MKLNHDCVRFLMLHVEENVPYGYFLNVNDIEHEKFNSEELLYAADKLLEANFLDGNVLRSIGQPLPNIRIKSITWSGHQFLDNIRDDGVWKDTKKVVSKFSSVSLSLIGNIASQILTSLIQNQIGVH